MNSKELFKHLLDRGFPSDIQKEFGLICQDDHIRINYYDCNGKNIYFRKNQPGRDPKYLSPRSENMPEGHTWLYNLQNLKYIKETMFLIEGEYNTISAWIMGYYGLGVSGQSMTLRQYHLKLIPERVKKIIILYDEAKFAVQRAEEILNYFDFEKEVYIAQYPDRKDANDYLKNGLNNEFKAIINTADRYFGDRLKSTSIKIETSSTDFVEAYCNDYACDISDGPRKYQELMALSVISTVLKRQVYLSYGVHNLYPNLFVVLLGKSTVMRKTHALNMAKYLISKVNESLILPNDFTPEGLFSLLSDKPCGLISWSEFGGFLVNANSKTYQAGIKEFLTESYDCPAKLNKRLVNNEYTIKDVYLNIITASTTDWFTENIAQKDMLGGFLGRFVYIPCRPQDKNGWYPMPRPGNSQLISALVIKLKEIAGLKGEMNLSDSARTVHIKWLRRHEEEIESLDDSKGIIGFYSRLSDYLLKFAMLYEISASKSLRITENSMLRSINLVNWLKQSLKELIRRDIEFTKEGKEISRVLKIIEDKGTVARAVLLRNSNLSARKLDEILATLIQSDQIQETYVQESRKKMTAYKSNILTN